VLITVECLPVVKMKTRTIMRKFGILFAACVFAAAWSAAQDEDFSKVQMKVSKVAGNVYILMGAGGNIGASVGDDGIVIVDDQYAPLADKIQAALKGITDKPVRFIINTHYHPDHTGGNAYFQKQAPIIAQDNVRKRLESGGGGGNGGSIHMDMKPAPHEALPIITFDHDVTVHLNGEDIRASLFPCRTHRWRLDHLLPALERRAHGRRLRHIRLSLYRRGERRQHQWHDRCCREGDRASCRRM
jgi:hypothetical protein